MPATVKLVFVPEQISAVAAGCVAITTGAITDNKTAVELTEAAQFETTTRYWFPSAAIVAGFISKLAAVAPGILVNAGTAAVLTCHWYPAISVPATENETLVPVQTV